VPEPFAFEGDRARMAAASTQQRGPPRAKPVSVFVTATPRVTVPHRCSDASVVVWEGWWPRDPLEARRRGRDPATSPATRTGGHSGLDPLSAPSQRIWGYERRGARSLHFTKVQAQQLLPRLLPQNLTWEEAASYPTDSCSFNRLL